MDDGVSVGDGVKIQNNVSVYRGVSIGDRVFVGPSVVFTNDLYPRADSVDWQIVPTNVGAGASIGASATILCGNSIGRRAMIAAAAVVTRDVEANELVGGNPARRLGWVCERGHIISRAETRPTSLRCETCQAGT